MSLDDQSMLIDDQSRWWFSCMEVLREKKTNNHQTAAKYSFYASRTNFKLFTCRLCNIDLTEYSVALKRFSVTTPDHHTCWVTLHV